jgi:hypothetical protein
VRGACAGIELHAQRDLGVLQRHVAPGALAFVASQCDLHAGNRRFVLVLRQHVDHDAARWRLRREVLREEGEQHVGFAALPGRRKMRVVAQMAAAAHHGVIHAGRAVVFHRDDDVDIFVARAVGVLLVQHAAEHGSGHGPAPPFRRRALRLRRSSAPTGGR